MLQRCLRGKRFSLGAVSECHGCRVVMRYFCSLPTSTELIVGDGRLVEGNVSGACQKCMGLRRRVLPKPPSTTTKSVPPVTETTPPLAYIPSLMSTTLEPPEMVEVSVIYNLPVTNFQFN